MKKLNLNEIKEFINYSKTSLKELFSKKWYRQIPNILTFSRLLSPFIIIPFVLNNKIITSFWIVGIFALTDLFDGFISRKFNITSEFGKRLDPICDKIFAISSVIPIIPSYKLLIITIILEILIAFFNLYSSLKNNNPKTSWLGKIKTIVLSITIVSGYLNVLNKKISILFLFFFNLTILMQLLALYSYYLIDKEKTAKKENRRSK